VRNDLRVEAVPSVRVARTRPPGTPSGMELETEMLPRVEKNSKVKLTKAPDGRVLTTSGTFPDALVP
jgi:hypothetical protein